MGRFNACASERRRLAASPEERDVLDGFRAGRADCPAPDAPAGRWSRADAAWRRLPRVLRLPIAFGLGMAVIYAAITLAAFWRAAHLLAR